MKAALPYFGSNWADLVGSSVRSSCALKRRAAGAAVLAFVVVVVTSCTTVSGPPLAVDAQLESLTVVTRPSDDAGYSRSAYGTAWADIDANGCRQREDALFAGLDRSQPFGVRRRGSCSHDVLAGTWTDPYTGGRLIFDNLDDPRQARAIPIDHVVALSVAHRYGAAGWTEQQRKVFANDLSNLQPTSAASNQNKGGRDAADWRPPRRQQCAYAERYVAVKARYRLAVDRSEKAALMEMLSTCPAAGRPQ